MVFDFTKKGRWISGFAFFMELFYVKRLNLSHVNMHFPYPDLPQGAREVKIRWGESGSEECPG
jgi:hypothetical protein